MSRTSRLRTGATAPARYAAEVLLEPSTRADGVHHGRGARLPWSAVERAFAAEVGEPEGVRTIVFDLVAPADASGARRGWRLDADPGEGAIGLARAIERGLSGRRERAVCAAIKSLATDGVPSRWYPDLVAYEEALVAQLDD